MRNARKCIKNGIEWIKDLLYPRRCPVCDDVVPIHEGLICMSCRPRIHYITSPRCQKCGKQLADDGVIYCMDCQTKQHYFTRGYALYDYQSMKKSIYRYKYGGRCEYARFYAEDIYRCLRDVPQLWDADAIIPVPLHEQRRRQRGYNQAELIAKEIGKISQIPVYQNVVVRVRKTVPQKELDAFSRQNNLKKAFNITSDVVKLKKTIIIDDIYTTGSTVDAISKKLKEYGVGEVYVLTLCIGEGI